MAYKDKEKQRAAERECKRRKRAGTGVLRQTRGKPELAALRLETAQDAVAALRAELDRVVQLCTGEESGEVLARARTVAGLLVTFLRAVEVAELLPRLEALEAQMEGPGLRAVGGGP